MVDHSLGESSSYVFNESFTFRGFSAGVDVFVKVVSGCIKGCMMSLLASEIVRDVKPGVILLAYGCFGLFFTAVTFEMNHMSIYCSS